MELTLEEVLDIVLETVSSSVAIGLMGIFLSSTAFITIIERLF